MSKGMRRPGIYSPGTISIKELAALAGVSVSTLYNWRERGILESIEIGKEAGVIRIDRRAALAWIKTNGRAV